MAMQVIRNLDAVELTTNTIVTIGTFDGVHRGHQHLLNQLVQQAQQTQRLSAVLTFHPHPRIVLQPEARPVYLSAPEERAALIASLGIDLLLILPFTPALADTPAEVFISNLYERLRLRELWVGADFALGRRREGGAPALQALAARLGYTLRVVSPMAEEGQVISSTRIRTLLTQGDVVEAARLLGRAYVVSGPVVTGFQRGRTLGFRTANVQVSPERAMPANGVYAVWALLDTERYAAVANVGIRPSFDAGERTLEVHLLDYEGDLYGKSLTIEFVHWLRAECRFADAAALVQQIQQDVAQARELLWVQPT